MQAEPRYKVTNPSPGWSETLANFSLGDIVTWGSVTAVSLPFGYIGKWYRRRQRRAQAPPAEPSHSHPRSPLLYPHMRRCRHCAGLLIRSRQADPRAHDGGDWHIGRAGRLHDGVPELGRQTNRPPGAVSCSVAALARFCRARPCVRESTAPISVSVMQALLYLTREHEVVHARVKTHETRQGREQ